MESDWKVENSIPIKKNISYVAAETLGDSFAVLSGRKVEKTKGGGTRQQLRVSRCPTNIYIFYFKTFQSGAVSIFLAWMF